MAVKTIQILVEGVNDLDFLGNYLLAVFNAILLRKEGKNKILLKVEQRALIEIRTPMKNKGWGYVQTEAFINDLKQADDQGHVSLVILDADVEDVQDDGGYVNRTALVNARREVCIAQGLSFEYFLWPNNTQDGQVETLLEHIMKEDCQSIFTCIKDQESCIRTVIQQQPDQSYIKRSVKLSPNKDILKNNMNSFKARLDNKTSSKFDRGRGFQNSNIWNLHDPYLEPLKIFLQTHL